MTFAHICEQESSSIWDELKCLNNFQRQTHIEHTAIVQSTRCEGPKLCIPVVGAVGDSVETQKKALLVMVAT